MKTIKVRTAKCGQKAVAIIGEGTVLREHDPANIHRDNPNWDVHERMGRCKCVVEIVGREPLYVMETMEEILEQMK